MADEPAAGDPNQAFHVPPPIPGLNKTWDVFPHRPDGGVPLRGMFLVLGTMLLVGLVLGVFCGWISQWIHLILIFPAAIGLGLGLAGALAVTRGQVRNTVFAGAAGFGGGVLAIVAEPYTEYQLFLQELPPGMG